MKDDVSSKGVDRLYLMGMLMLVILGVVIIYSSSGSYAQSKNLPDTFYLFHHLEKVGIGLFALVLGLSVPYKFWKKVAYLGALFVIGLLLFLLVSKSVVGVHGAKRWISIASFGLQPSELAKVILVFFMGRFLVENESIMSHFKKGLLKALIMPGIFFTLVLLQPNYSSSATILAIAFAMIFIGGAKFSHMLGLSSLFIPMLGYFMVSSPYRMKRVMAFLNPSENTASAYQSIQSLISLGNGGFSGTGLGTSTQKLGYLPMPFTDTIFSILGEELGFIGTMGCLFLFALIIWRGISIAYNCPDRFGSMVAMGITTGLIVNVIMHVGVCTGFFPTTGQTLPFVSYGGTALCSMLFLSGVLLNISRNRGETSKAGIQRPKIVSQHRFKKLKPA